MNIEKRRQDIIHYLMKNGIVSVNHLIEIFYLFYNTLVFLSTYEKMPKLPLVLFEPCIGRAVNLVKMMELKPISPNVKRERRGPRLTDAPRNGTLIF